MAASVKLHQHAMRKGQVQTIDSSSLCCHDSKMNWLIKGQQPTNTYLSRNLQKLQKFTLTNVHKIEN